MVLHPTLISRIIKAQCSDLVIFQRLTDLIVDLLDDFPLGDSIGVDGGLKSCGHLCIPDIP